MRRHPLVMTLSLHPFVVGQPFRLPSLRKALKHCVEHAKRDRVWWTTPGAGRGLLLRAAAGNHSGRGAEISADFASSRRPVYRRRQIRKSKEDHHGPIIAPARARQKRNQQLGHRARLHVVLRRVRPVRGRRRHRADPRGARPPASPCSIPRTPTARARTRRWSATRSRAGAPASCSPPSSAISAAPAANTPTAGRSSS